MRAEWYPELLRETEIFALSLSAASGVSLLKGEEDPTQDFQLPRLEQVLDGRKGRLRSADNVKRGSQADILYRMLDTPGYLTGFAAPRDLFALPQAISLAARTDNMFDWDKFDSLATNGSKTLPSDAVRARYDAVKGLRADLFQLLQGRDEDLTLQQVKTVIQDKAIDTLVDEDAEQLYRSVAKSFNNTRRRPRQHLDITEKAFGLYDIDRYSSDERVRFPLR